MGCHHDTPARWPAGGRYGKQPDECLWPPARRGGQTITWPTLVFETGVSESLSRRRRDAAWWFANSEGQVRIVLVMTVQKSHQKLLIEKWQLAQPNSPSPLTDAAALQLRQQVPPPLPPLTKQPRGTQRPFALQAIEVTPTGVSGAPLVLPFEALFCRPPQGNERDIIIISHMLTKCLHHLKMQLVL